MTRSLGILAALVTGLAPCACSRGDSTTLFDGTDGAAPLDGGAGTLPDGTALGVSGSGGRAGNGGAPSSAGAGGAASGGSAGSAGARGAADAGTDAGPARHFRLATTGAQLVVSGAELGLQLTKANVADDADVVAVHQEFYGVPWDSFEADAPPPAEWAAMMHRFSTAASDAGKPVFLSISMLNGQRETLASKTRIENGQVKADDGWAARCYDFRTAADAAAKRTAYLRYVAYMVREFHPAYLNVAIEVNLFFEKCAAATPGLIELIDATYDAVKKQAKDTVVFPSFQIDHLYGYSKDSCPDPSKRATCFDDAYAVIAPIRRDRFAMSTYPYMNEVGTPENLPVDWFSRGAGRAAERPLIAETGWPSTDLVVKAKDGSCPRIFAFDEAESLVYLERVLADAGASDLGLDLVTWWSDRDLLVDDLMTSCPCTFDTTWCTVLDIFRGPPTSGGVDTQLYGELLLKAFGTMGLRSYDGTPKAGHLGAWQRVKKQPFAG